MTIIIGVKLTGLCEGEGMCRPDDPEWRHLPVSERLSVLDTWFPVRELWVVDCCLINDRRCQSQYVVRATSKKEARDKMRDGDHVVGAAHRLADLWESDYYLFEDVEMEDWRDVVGGNPYCLWAGT